MAAINQETANVKQKRKNEVLEWMKSIAFGILLFMLVRTFIFSNYIVQGESMMPTFQNGNMLIVNKIGLHLGELKRFDIIVFHADEEEDYVKRLIGLPGDQIEYRKDELYVNGKRLNEPYLADYKKKIFKGQMLTGDFTLQELTKKTIVPKGKVFVLGDNRMNSLDSRHFGFIQMDQIVGKVNLRYWPLEQFNTEF